MDNDALQQLFGAWAAKHGWATTLLVWVGTARFAMKPIASWVTAAITRALAYVRNTPETDDDALLQRVMRSKVYRVLAFLVDWTASVKLPGAEPQSAERGTRNAEQPKAPGSGGAGTGAMLMLCAMLAGGGCATWQDTDGKLLASTAQSADAAMKGWAAYVADGHAAPAQEAKVMAAYQKYQAAMRVAREAYERGTRNAERGTDWSAAATALAASAAELTLQMKDAE